MEAIGRSNSSIEFHRYNRRKFPVPVLPPKVPVTHIPVAKFLSYKSNEHNDGNNSIHDKTHVVNVSAKSIPGVQTDNDDAISYQQSRTQPANADYPKGRDDACENGKSAFNLVDKKREEEKNYCTALTTTSASVNAFQESSIRVRSDTLSPVSTANNAGDTNGRHRYSPDKHESRDDDTDRIRSDGGVKYDYNRNPPVPLRTSKRAFSMEAQRTRSPALVARKIDLSTLSSDCLARNSNERVSSTLDYRLRYGLSSLEISSKYLSDRNEVLQPNNVGIASYPKSYSSDGPFTYRTSTAAAFFARASQKLKLNSSPHKRKRRGSSSDDGASASTSVVKSIGGFSNLLHRNPPAIPSTLLRKIGQKETTGIGKVKVLVKVCADSVTLAPEDGQSPVFTMDKKKKQIALYEPQPTTNSATTTEEEERKPSISAPKMFAFEALFSDDDPQVEVCGHALTDVIHAVINGNDGCICGFGNAKIGKTKLMIGSSESPATLGVIPCAIAWLYRAIDEQRQKTGARFSVRVSAIEITAVSQQIKDLLTDYASDNEQSPGVYLKDDPILGSHLQNRSELRAPLPEKAAFYLDAAQSERSTAEDSHFLYTLHVYQYNLANKGAVAGGRSRLYLIDLAGNDRSKGGSCLSISNLGNVLLAILNGQKHLPHRDHKITQVLKECLSSFTCHAAIIAHVSPLAQHYHETLATVQFASRIHRIRRRKIKFVGVSNGINTTTDETGRLTSSSDFDPSSSEQSADTVIYVGPSEETDGEHPPVCIPSLNSADNRGVLSKVLRETDTDYHRASKLPLASRSVPASPMRTPKTTVDNTKLIIPPYSPVRRHHLKTSGFHSAHSSPVRTVGKAPDSATGRLLEELWIDGPRISKSKIAEARNVQLMRKEGQKVFGKREMWVDGPMKKELAYGFMDSHKKSMIRKWVENQSMQLQHRIKSMEERRNSYKALTVFKTCENGAETETEDGRGQGSGQEDDNEAKMMNREWQSQNTEEMDLNKKYHVQRIDARYDENNADSSDEEIEIEIVEVEEPEEPVPMQDSCLQVTEEDIALCMGELENPLPEVDQEEHPLRVLSQENMTVVSTFTDSLSVTNDLERLFPRSRWCLQNGNCQLPNGNLHGTRFFNPCAADKDKTRSQLFKLHEIYENKFDLNSCIATSKHLNGDTVRAVSRCQSMMLSELCNPGENNLRSNDFENSSIASEPAYKANNTGDDRLCENCKVSLTSMPHAAIEKTNLWSFSHQDDPVSNKFQSYRHLKNIMNLRHPDGASNPNLQEVEGNGKLTNGNKDADESVSDDDEDSGESVVPPPPPTSTSKLLTLSREGFNGSLFTKCCDSPDFVDAFENENLCNGSKSEHLLGLKSFCARANVKKLQTYRLELKNKK